MNTTKEIPNNNETSTSTRQSYETPTSTTIPAIEGGTPIRESKLYYGHQYLDEADYEAVLEVLKSDYLTCGPKID